MSSRSDLAFKVVNGYRVPSTCTEEELLLARRNMHLRDREIIFDEGPHKYYVKGQEGYTSATTFIHEFFEHFDAVHVAGRMIQRKDFGTAARYREYNLMRTEPCEESGGGSPCGDDELVRRIIRSWEKNAEVQSGLGTRMHRAIELFYNQETSDMDSKECSYFQKFHEETLARGWKPLRTEMIVWDEDAKLCGSIDMIYIEKGVYSQACVDNWRAGHGTIHIHLVDWKRSKQISMNSFGKYGKGCCSAVPDSNYFHYRLQLNLYKYILEKRYRVVVDSMAIVVCHPNNDTFLEFVLGDEGDLIGNMVKERKKSLLAAGGVGAGGETAPPKEPPKEPPEESPKEPPGGGP